MTETYTDEQLKYINYSKKTDTKLLACAGSGKTRCIIARMNYLLTKKVYEPTEILMLTFSRFTRDDFMRKVETSGVLIPQTSIKTIDSYAKSLIDKDNEIDVSLLSYKFMKYLENTTVEKLNENQQLKMLKCLFIDESQDLNETQYKICIFLKTKMGVKINLIGDPNQNIYQFRNSSDKFLMEFKAPTFYLTKNFRSHSSIIEFSKYIRPFGDMEIEHTKGDNDCKPVFIFNDGEKTFETHLIDLLKTAFDNGIDPSDFAILAPTRGRMKGNGRSNGLCFITNVLFKAKIKFKQFYEEGTEETTTSIKYDPEKGYVNILTYMGSKGLEWKYVILVDADMCLINKRVFTKDKHDHDRYLLYVACSRAIENMFIFSRVTRGRYFQLNPWFEKIPKELYLVDENYAHSFKFPELKYVSLGDNEKRVTKIIDRMNEETLNDMAELVEYGKEMKKQTIKIFKKHYTDIYSPSSIFLGKYVENLFNCYLNIRYNREHKRYIDIENIALKSEKILTNVPSQVTEWYYANRDNMTWEKYDMIKESLDPIVSTYVKENMKRSIDISSYTIINDGYYKWYILLRREWIKRVYNDYLTCVDVNKIHKYLFYVVVILYTFETQHYFHVREKGVKFSKMLKTFGDMFNEIKEYALTTEIEFVKTNVLTTHRGIIGEIDTIDSDDEIWEIKCVNDISLKHILQLLVYNVMYRYNEISKNDTNKIVLRYINFLKGEIISIPINLTKEKLDKLIKIMIQTSNLENTK